MPAYRAGALAGGHPARRGARGRQAICPPAAAGGSLAQRDHDRQTAAGTVTGERIRDLTPGSLIITVQVRQVITTASGRSEVAEDIAVTVVRASGGQAVWDVEPAAAGNTGGDPR